MIMKRTMIPIEFNSAYFIKMNLDSFVAVSTIFNNDKDSGVFGLFEFRCDKRAVSSTSMNLL